MFLSTIIVAYYASNDNVSEHRLRIAQFKQLNHDTRLSSNRFVYLICLLLDQDVKQPSSSERSRAGLICLFVY